VGDLIVRSLPFLPFAMLPAIALLLAPLLGRRGRTSFAIVLGVIALAFVADVLLLDHSGVHTLEVPNAFPRAPDARAHVWIVDEVTAPAWQWHLVAAAFFALAGGLCFVRRDRPPAPPPPVLAGAGVFVYYLALRLGLEKTAAPEEIVWAAGVTPASLLIAPFFGWYCGRRGYGFARFAKHLLLLLYVQRLPLVAFACFATTQGLGTHLDTHLVTDIQFPGLSSRTLTTPTEAWLWPTAVPQLTLAIVFALVIGMALGALPRWLANRRNAAGAAAPA
jgi:hypothetical protein